MTRLRRRARRLLRFGPRSIAEVRASLSAPGARRDQIEAVTGELCAEGQLDDRASARLWASHLARAGYAASAIAARLAQRGFDATSARGAVGRLEEDDEPRARRVLKSALARRRRSQGREAPESVARLRSRLTRRLLQRGFERDLIEQVVAKALGSEGLPDDER